MLWVPDGETFLTLHNFFYRCSEEDTRLKVVEIARAPLTKQLMNSCVSNLNFHKKSKLLCKNCSWTFKDIGEGPNSLLNSRGWPCNVQEVRTVAKIYYFRARWNVTNFQVPFDAVSGKLLAQIDGPLNAVIEWRYRAFQLT